MAGTGRWLILNTTMLLSPQRLVYWLESGAGYRGVRILAVAAGLLALGLYLGMARYAGPPAEAVLEDALLAASLARGDGFSGAVIYPQAVAVLESRQGTLLTPATPVPDMYRPPLYPLFLAGVVKALPEGLGRWLWAEPGLHYHRADFYLYAVNLFLLWLVLFLVWLHARLLFGRAAGYLALGGGAFSLGLWKQALEVSGSLLLAVWVLLALGVVLWREQRRREAASWTLWREGLAVAALGLLAGALFLTEYAAGLLSLVFLGYVLLTIAGWRQRLGMAAVFVGVLLLVAGPWCWRNITLTGYPTGLAWHHLALRAKDTTAEPRDFRNTLQSEAPKLSLPKLAHKGLGRMRDLATGSLWEGGAHGFAAFFLVALVYPFREPARRITLQVSIAMGLVMFLAGGCFTTGESLRQPEQWLAPLMLIFGAGFFLLLLESVRGESRPVLLAGSTVLLLWQLLTLGPLLLQPAQRHHYTFPPYHPKVMEHVMGFLFERLPPGVAVMSDVPAGLAWYGRTDRVWSQPQRMVHFMDIHVHRQRIGALYLSPLVLNRPFFSQLLQQGESAETSQPEHLAAWGAVYASLAGSVPRPAYFPLSWHERVSRDTYLLTQPALFVQPQP